MECQSFSYYGKDFADLLEVGFGIDQVKFQWYVRVKIALHMGKTLPEIRYFAFARNVYPIRFCRSWDICSSSSSAWGPSPPTFSMGSVPQRGNQRPPGRPFRQQKCWRGGSGSQYQNKGKHVWKCAVNPGRGAKA